MFNYFNSLWICLERRDGARRLAIDLKWHGVLCRVLDNGRTRVNDDGRQLDVCLTAAVINRKASMLIQQINHFEGAPHLLCLVGPPKYRF